MTDTFSQDMSPRRQLRLMGIIFGIFIAILALSYFLFLRLNYSLLYQNLPISDASAIVAELDAREIKYRLRNGGKDIHVPAVDADAIRLGILDSEAPRKKIDGFELFNDSEMGLTDFAQKIKYQRALQGELARTIMMIEGVENARVHIAMPERVLFRGNTSSPTAAVTIVTRSGQFDEETRISGIQRLVAASVPDLDSDQVSVLNSAGEIISPVETPISSVLTEYARIAGAYSEQVEIALALEIPELIYDLKLLARPIRNLESKTSDGEKMESKETPEQTRDYSLKVLLTTDEKLLEQDESRISDIITEAVQLNVKAGDIITFRQRNLPLNLSLENATNNKAVSIAKQINDTPAKYSLAGLTFSNSTLTTSVIAGGTLMLLSISGVVISRRRRQFLQPEEHIEFAQRLKLQLQDFEEVNNGNS